MFFMNDLKTRQDIEILLKNFYEKALKDKVIGYIFTDVAKLDLEHHLPIITDGFVSNRKFPRKISPFANVGSSSIKRKNSIKT
jgi:hypothetical protein